MGKTAELSQRVEHLSKQNSHFSLLVQKFKENRGNLEKENSNLMLKSKSYEEEINELKVTIEELTIENKEVEVLENAVQELMQKLREYGNPVKKYFNFNFFDFFIYNIKFN